MFVLSLLTSAPPLILSRARKWVEQARLPVFEATSRNLRREANSGGVSVGLGAIVVWLIVGLIAGFLAGKVVTGHGMGLIWDVVVGILGAFVGGWLASLMGFAVSNILVQIIVAFIGAVILLILFRAVAGRSRMRA